MNETLRPAQLDWSQGQPQAIDFGDIYFSRDDGAAETRHVFLEGNQLGARFSVLAPAQGFTIIETGFGTGLNWLCTQALWADSHKAASDRPGWLHYLSIEKHPLTASDLARAQDCWPAFAEFAKALQHAYPALVPGFHRLVFPQWRSTLTLVFSDIADALPRISAQADAWFLDGFAPSRNPQMWTTDLYEGMAGLSAAGSSFATFTAAGDVRRGLAAAGFEVEKVTGFGKKREMLRGIFQKAEKTPRKTEKPWLARPVTATDNAREAIIIGAGIAGAASARALALRGWRIKVLEKNTVASAASGNPAAVVALTAAPPGEALDHFPQQASIHALRELEGINAADSPWHACGVIELAARSRRKNSPTENPTSIPATHWQFVDAETASKMAGIHIATDAVWQAHSGWLDAAAYCRELLNHPGISVHENVAVSHLEYAANSWHALDDTQQIRAQASTVIIANSHSATAFSQSTSLPLRHVRGQISLANRTSASEKLKTVICARGYITPTLPDGQHCLGASFIPDDENTDIRASEHQENFDLLHSALPELATALPVTQAWQGRSSLRCQSPDYMPLVGPLADSALMRKDYVGLRDGKHLNYPELTTLPGLYVNLAHGSHGFSQATLTGEILASELNAEPAPVSQKILDALHPMRFLIRDIKRGKPE